MVLLFSFFCPKKKKVGTPEALQTSCYLLINRSFQVSVCCRTHFSLCKSYHCEMVSKICYLPALSYEVVQKSTHAIHQSKQSLHRVSTQQFSSLFFWSRKKQLLDPFPLGGHSLKPTQEQPQRLTDNRNQQTYCWAESG